MMNVNKLHIYSRFVVIDKTSGAAVAQRSYLSKINASDPVKWHFWSQIAIPVIDDIPKGYVSKNKDRYPNQNVNEGPGISKKKSVFNLDGKPKNAFLNEF